ncbi:MAG: TolC family protein [bacterium]
MRKKTLILILLMFLFIRTEYSKAEEVLNLKELVNTALKENLYIKAKQYSVIAADRDLASANSSFYPKLILEEKFTTGDQTSYSVFTKLNQQTLTAATFLNPGSATNFQTSLTAEMPIYVKELFLMKDSKRLSLLSTSKDYERFQEEIAFQVFKGYINVIKSKAFKQTAEKSLEEAKEVYRIAKVRAETGTGLKSDELRALVFLKDKESSLIKAENDLLVSKRALGLIVSKDEPIDVREGDEVVLTLPEIDDVIAKVLESRNDYLAKRFDVENSQKYYELQKSRFYPKVFLSGSYYNDGRNLPLGSDGTGYVVGLALRWDLFDKTRYDDEAKTKYQALMAREALKQFEKEVKFNVEVSYLKVEESKKRVEVAKEAVKEGEETFRLIKLRYDNNLSTIVELLDAELSLINARNNLIIAENEYYEAVGKTLFEAGLFLKSMKE